MDSPSFFSITAALFFILNATGQIPVFLALLGRFERKRQCQIIFRELLVALGILVLFTFCGDEILTLLGISRATLSIAGGILLFLISLTMIFPNKPEKEETIAEEPLIVPLATPIIAGPGTITAVMLYAHETGQPFFVSGALLLAWLASLCILLLGSYIKGILGKKGLTALERLGGMLLCLIGLQMATSGTLQLVKEFFNIGNL